MSHVVDSENGAVGGVAGIRELRGLRVTTLSVGPYDNNVYLLECATTGERLLIDAAAEPAAVLGVIGSGGLGQVLTTHFHYDHWGALKEVVERTGATTLMHPADAVGVPVPTDVEVRDGQEVRIGDVSLRAVHLVGHTLGSLALLYAEPGGPHHVWTGDSLFPGGVGNTHKEPALFEALYRDVVAKLFDVHDDSTAIYPGHGAATTLGAERPSLTQWRERGW
ncbi:MBL fold metallo-hydrolase [Streptomyces sp. NBC_00988]|uniref:MBL fold metallo-hydrolase n=1 Tax=Streptomyces sp. NBC_00988 TaxID=2903704 RepID=UPI00386FBE46|nr:MBL fold metallo-hydrolase [Streptomyces sp. NBC_00988]